MQSLREALNPIIQRHKRKANDPKPMSIRESMAKERTDRAIARIEMTLRSRRSDIRRMS